MSNRFCFVQDDDYHWYLILAEMKDEFYDWVDAVTYNQDWQGIDFTVAKCDRPSKYSFKDVEEICN